MIEINHGIVGMWKVDPRVWLFVLPLESVNQTPHDNSSPVISSYELRGGGGGEGHVVPFAFVHARRVKGMHPNVCVQDHHQLPGVVDSYP